MSNSQLGRADWVGEIDIQQCIAGGAWKVAGGRRAGWVPERGERLLEHCFSTIQNGYGENGSEQSKGMVVVQAHRRQRRGTRYLRHQTPWLRYGTYAPIVAILGRRSVGTQHEQQSEKGKNGRRRFVWLQGGERGRRR